MSKASTAKTSSDARDDAPLRRADDTAGKRVLRTRRQGAAVVPNKQRVNIILDGTGGEHVKSMAGDRDCRTLIKEALRRSIQAESLESIGCSLSSTSHAAQSELSKAYQLKISVNRQKAYDP